MEEFNGFLFVNYDRNAESLADYLAGAAEYLEDDRRPGAETAWRS